MFEGWKLTDWLCFLAFCIPGCLLGLAAVILGVTDGV